MTAKPYVAMIMQIVVAVSDRGVSDGTTAQSAVKVRETTAGGDAGATAKAHWPNQAVRGAQRPNRAARDAQRLNQAATGAQRPDKAAR